MTATPLPPRIALELVDKALVLGKRHFWALMRLALIPFLAATGIVYLFGRPATTVTGRMAATLAAYVAYALMEAVTMVGAWDLLHGTPLDVGEAWSRVRRRAISVPTSFVIRIFLMVLGGIALVLPGLYFLAIYFAVPGVNAIEDLSLRASLARSRALALGSIPGILVSVGAYWILAVLVSLGLARGLRLLGAPFAVRTIVSISWGAVIVPFRAALSALVYLELRIRREGYDLQRALGSLPSAA